MANKVFSDFEIDLMGIKFEDEEAFETFECIGSYEESLNVKVISKKCRGIVKKKVVKGDGTGTIKISAHIPWAIYTKLFGTTLDTLAEGVKAHGQNSVHGKFVAVAHVTDEDGNEKYKAYPNCVVETGIADKIENGAEEVAEMELEIAVAPDDYGNGMYEALADEITDETIKNTWMTAFTSELVQLTNA